MDAMDNIDLNLIPVNALNYSSRHFLGQFLNPEQNLLSKDGYARDYRGLAEQMDFQYNDIRNFQRHEDPTMKILEAWAVQPNATVGKLIQFLENMGRHDVVQDLQSRFEKDSRVYLQKLEKLQDSPLQVPEVTSCRSQHSPLDDLNVLTREDAYTGECTLYDAYVSYADDDLHFVYNLSGYLEAAGFKLFIRSRDLLAGHSEYETNMQLIKGRCKRVLIVLSPAFLNCPACEVQARFAASLGFDERRRKIIPILWKPCEIPLILRYVSKIDFTKPGVQDWIWDQLKSSLQDVSSSTFISSEKRLAQGQITLPQIESCTPDTSNPAITFPPTVSCTLNSDTFTGACTSSVDAVHEEIINDSVLIVAKSSTPPKQKNKLQTFRFWQTKKVPKKNDIYSSNNSSSASVSSSSNATSGFHSQSGNGLESVDITTGACSQDTPV